VHCTRD